MQHKEYIVRILVVIGCIALSLSAGCSSGSRQPETVPASTVSPFPDFSDLVQKVSLSVVAINTEGVTYDALNDPRTTATAGSGWIFDDQGTVITNNHVIEGANSITVELYDHKAYPARLISTDPLTDIAVLKLNTSRKLVPVPVADTSQISIGDWVLILGNPLGLGISAKEGIVSRLGVTMASSPEQTYYNLIETSAPVNAGNSGGPMVNLDGEVIGMTSLKIDAVGVEGMGYAIDIVDIVPVIRVLMDGSELKRAWLGATAVSMDNGLAVQYDLPVETGALVAGVAAFGPADMAGIEVGDVIVAMDGKEVTTAEGLDRTVSACAIGQTVNLTVWHQNSKKMVELVLTECPTPVPSPTPTT